jgi:hypothetical protein
MFLFYSLMCRNYQEYKRKPCWSRIGTFLKSVWKLFLKIGTYRTEDDVKRKNSSRESCREFSPNGSGHKIRPNPSPDGRDKPDLLQPYMGWRESEKLYKGRNLTREEHLIPTNFQPPKPRFCLPHGPHLHGGGLPRSHEGRGLRGGAPPWNRRRRRSPLRHRRCRRRPAPLAALSAVFTAISITNSSLYSVVHPPTNLCTVLCKHVVWCYNIYPMIYDMFV